MCDNLNSAPQAKILVFCVAQMRYKTVSKSFPHLKSTQLSQVFSCPPKCMRDSSMRDWESAPQSMRDVTRITHKVCVTEKLCCSVSSKRNTGLATRGSPKLRAGTRREEESQSIAKIFVNVIDRCSVLYQEAIELALRCSERNLNFPFCSQPPEDQGTVNCDGPYRNVS